MAGFPSNSVCAVLRQSCEVGGRQRSKRAVFPSFVCGNLFPDMSYVGGFSVETRGYLDIIPWFSM